MLFEARILSHKDTKLLEEFYQQYTGQTDMHLNLRLDRSPDFWEAISIHGFDNKVLAVIDKEKDHIAAACIISLRHSYISGSVKTTGYMSGMKARREYRGSLAFARFMQLFNSYWKENKAVCWMFSTFTDNEVLNKLMHTPHRLFPEVRIAARYTTYLFKPGILRKKTEPSDSLSFRFARKDDMEELTRFLNKEYQKLDFTQPENILDIETGSGSLKDMNLPDLLLAIRNDKIVGTAGLWDQSQYRRWYVDHYSTTYSLARPLINLVARIRNIPPLPASGKAIDYRLISILFVKNHDAEVCSGLISRLCQNVSDREIISLGLPDGHPLSYLFQRMRCIKLRNNLYLAYKKENEQMFENVKSERIYIEQGNL